MRIPQTEIIRSRLIMPAKVTEEGFFGPIRPSEVDSRVFHLAIVLRLTAYCLARTVVFLLARLDRSPHSRRRRRTGVRWSSRRSAWLSRRALFPQTALQQSPPAKAVGASGPPGREDRCAPSSPTRVQDFLTRRATPVERACARHGIPLGRRVCVAGGPRRGEKISNDI